MDAQRRRPRPARGRQRRVHPRPHARPGADRAAELCARRRAWVVGVVVFVLDASSLGHELFLPVRARLPVRLARRGGGDGGVPLRADASAARPARSRRSSAHRARAAGALTAADPLVTAGGDRAGAARARRSALAAARAADSSGRRTCSSSPRRAPPACCSRRRSIVKTLHRVRVLLPRGERHLLLNDALDVDADRMHPKKRYPPGRRRRGGGRRPRSRSARSCSRAARSRCRSRRRWQLALVIGGYVVLTLAYSALAQARAGARPRDRRVRASCCARSRAASPWACRSALVPDRRRRRARCSSSPASAAPSCGRSAPTRACTAASLAGYIEAYPRVRARGLVERRDPRVLPVGVREVGAGRATQVWFQLVDHPVRARHPSLRAAARRRVRAARPKSCALRPRAARSSALAWVVCFGDRGATVADERANRTATSEVLTGWGRTAPDARARCGSRARADAGRRPAADARARRAA